MLEGKVALVTGSTSGIGAGIATQLAKAGASIILHGLGDPAEIESFRTKLALDHGVVVRFVDGNLATAEGVEEMVKAAGNVDILVNNAGIQFVSPIQDFPEAKWNAVMAINLTAPFLTIKGLIGNMYKSGWGRIINVSSAHGLNGSPNKSAYVAAKHGLLGLNKVVALEAAEVKDARVTSNAICPGWVMTPLVKAQIEARAKESGKNFNDEAVALCGEKHPTLRFTTPEALGDAAVFLCSEAGDNMTGTEMVLDGGWNAR